MTNTAIATTPEMEALELAWGIIANASGGDWTKETEEWQKAAARWREWYHDFLADWFGRQFRT